MAFEVLTEREREMLQGTGQTTRSHSEKNYNVEVLI